MSGLRVEEAKPMDSLPFIVTSYAKDLRKHTKKQKNFRLIFIVLT